jgi:dodecin
MSNHVYKMEDFVGSSSEGTDGAIRNAIAEASKRVPNLRWFEVRQVRGQVVDGAVAHWQVEIRVGATLE